MKKFALSLVLVMTLCILGPISGTYAKTISNSTSPIFLELSVGNDPSSVSYKVSPDEVVGPSSFAVDGKIAYILDPNKKVIYVCENNQIIKKLDISFIPDARDIRIVENNIWILDSQTSSIIILDKNGNIVNKKSVDANNDKKPLFLDQFNNNVVLHNSDGSNANYDNNLGINKADDVLSKISIQSKKNANIDTNGRKTRINLQFNELAGSLNIIHEDSEALYIGVEELLDAPVIIVENTIRKYNKNGVLEGIASLPLDNYYAYPNRFYDVAKDGKVYAMVLSKDKVQIIELTLTKNFKSQLPEKKQKLESSALLNNFTQNSIMSLTALPSYSRSQLETRALNIINYSWTCTSNNVKTMSGVTVPTYLQAMSMPYTSSGIPYCWGGFNGLDTSLTFGSAISSGYNAGNIQCSGGYKSGTAGLDCSGFVSTVYGYSTKQSTTSLASSSDFRTITTSQLQYMDILVEAGDHVVMFKTDHFGLNVDTYEATTSGVEICKLYNRSWSSLSGYVPRTHF